MDESSAAAELLRPVISAARTVLEEGLLVDEGLHVALTRQPIDRIDTVAYEGWVPLLNDSIEVVIEVSRDARAIRTFVGRNADQDMDFRTSWRSVRSPDDVPEAVREELRDIGGRIARYVASGGTAG